MQVGSVARPRVHQELLRGLAQRILSGAIRPGEGLPSTLELMAELGVSRSALREAVKVLGAKGLVDVRPRTGTRVRARENWNLMDPEVLAWVGPVLDDDILWSLIECRQLIEPGAAALAATHASAAQLAVMEEAFDRMSKASDPGARVEADVDFHVAVMRSSGNLFLAQWASTVSTVLLAAFRMSTDRAISDDEAFSAHLEVLEAIRLRQSQRADRAMRRLLVVATKDLRLSGGQRA